MVSGFGGRPYVRQIAMDLPHAPKFGRQNFIEGASNAAALRLIDSWPEWPSPTAAIFGSAGIGKSHLVSVWAERAGAQFLTGSDLTAERVLSLERPIRVAVDDADQAAESADGSLALFHLINRVAQENGAALLSGTQAPKKWPTALPDLKSRLAALTSLEIGDADDELLAAVLVKLFADRQLHPSPELIAFVVTRIERSIPVAAQFVDAMDREMLETGRSLGPDLAAWLLREQDHCHR